MLGHWRNIFDETFAAGGVMVMLQHPWFQAAGGRPYEDYDVHAPDGLVALINPMYSRSSTAGSDGVRRRVVFTTMGEATRRYLEFLRR